MHRIAKAVIVGVFLVAFTLLLAPPASACCIPCQGFCNQPGIPPTAYCCTGIPLPDNACGLTICGKWLQSQRDPRAVADAASLFLVPQETQAAPGCDTTFPWLAEAETAPAL